MALPELPPYPGTTPWHDKNWDSLPPEKRMTPQAHHRWFELLRMHVVEPSAAGANNPGAIRYAEDFAGDDWSEKVRAAHDDLPSTGGTVDARGLEGEQSASGTVVVDRPLVLLIGASTITYPGAGGDPLILVKSNGVYIIGHTPQSTILQYTGTTPIDVIRFEKDAPEIIAYGALDSILVWATEAVASTLVRVVNPVFFSFKRVFMRHSSLLTGTGVVPNPINGIVMENTVTAIPPTGNITLEDIIYATGTGADNDSATGIGIYIKGRAAADGQMINIRYQGTGDIEASGVAIRQDYAFNTFMDSGWLLSGATGYKGVASQLASFLGVRFANAAIEHNNLDSGCYDHVYINPSFSNPNGFGTDSGHRTVKLNSATGIYDLADVPLSTTGEVNTGLLKPTQIQVGELAASAPVVISKLPNLTQGMLHIRPPAGNDGFMTWAENAVASIAAMGFVAGEINLEIRHGESDGPARFMFTMADGHIRNNGELQFKLNSVGSPTTGFVLGGNATGVRNITCLDENITMSGLHVLSSTGARQASAKVVIGLATLNILGTATVFLSGPAVFSNANSYVVVGTNLNGATALKITPTSGSSFTITSAAASIQTIGWIAAGN